MPVIQGYMEIHTLLVHSSNPPDVLQAPQRQPLPIRQGESQQTGGGAEVAEQELEAEEKEDMITFSPKMNGE